MIIHFLYLKDVKNCLDGPERHLEKLSYRETWRDYVIECHALTMCWLLTIHKSSGRWHFHSILQRRKLRPTTVKELATDTLSPKLC